MLNRSRHHGHHLATLALETHSIIADVGSSTAVKVETMDCWLVSWTLFSMPYDWILYTETMVTDRLYLYTTHTHTHLPRTFMLE